MNPVTGALQQIAKDLGVLGRKWALVGGLAVSARAEPRTTRDVDLAVAVTNDADAEALILALQARGYRVLMALEQETTKRLATVRLLPPAGTTQGVVTDLLFASSGIECEIVDSAENLAILPDFEVPVARLGHLLALKVLARDDRRRPQDWDDIRALLAETTAEDLAQARIALSLIEQRGFHRDKPLGILLQEMIDERTRL